MAVNNKVLNFVKDIYPIAKKLNLGNAIFITAQAGLESGWGNSRIGDFNLWGIKCSAKWKGRRVLVRTKEILKSDNGYIFPAIYSIKKLENGMFLWEVSDWFCDFNSLEEALQYHFSVLEKPHFARAKQYINDPYRYVQELQAGQYKYATDSDYVKKMFTIIKMVQQAVDILKL